jgi:hypothetical protein
MPVKKWKERNQDTDKQDRREESKNPDTTESTWGERVQKKEK